MHPDSLILYTVTQSGALRLGPGPWATYELHMSYRSSSSARVAGRVDMTRSSVIVDSTPPTAATAAAVVVAVAVDIPAATADPEEAAAVEGGTVVNPCHRSDSHSGVTHYRDYRPLSLE
jgi:hypothetical protein